MTGARQSAANSLDIVHGDIIIPWADACEPLGRVPLAAGWCLPGGERTGVPEVAMRVAEILDQWSKP
jgi:hypothetical protein